MTLYVVNALLLTLHLRIVFYSLVPLGRPLDTSRLISVEESLRKSQEQLQDEVAQKEQVITEQQAHIRSLDAANSQLIAALNSLRDRHPAPTNQQQSYTKLTLEDASQFQSSSC